MAMPSNFERQLGRAIQSALGSSIKVSRFGDDDGLHECSVIRAENSPVDGVTSYGSVGLSEDPQSAGSVKMLVEVVAACASSTHNIDNLVSSCVFDSKKNGTDIIYGAYIPDIVDQYQISNTMRHVTFVAPFLWEGLGRINVEGKNVHCLMMLPISDNELYYLQERGVDELERIFEKSQIDIFDINRASAL